MNSLKQLDALGQSVWLDYIQRNLIRSGELRRMVTEDGLRGMTSNPTLFEEAITKTDDYTDDIHKFVKQHKSFKQIYDQLTVHDVSEAADVFLNTFEQTLGDDGFVSLEVNPHLAYDTDGTIEEARRLWHELNRPNVFIKVPATEPGLRAITQLISEGINVNVTILFGLPRYREVAEAYIAGLEERQKAGHSIKKVRSVASFFLSRIDVKVDPMLEKLMDGKGEQASLAKKLHGQVAIASAKIAYQDFLDIFAQERFLRLVGAGAQSQRLLWASTGTKNPAYSDIKYVQPLIGSETVNTMPLQTLNSYLMHGKPKLTLQDDLEDANWVLESLPKVGIDIDEITKQLEEEGVEKFNKAYDSLMASLENVCQKHK